MASPHQKGVLSNNFKESTKDGKKEVITLNPKAINIIWGGESCEGRYWRRTTIDSFEVAELVSVYWLEVTGQVPLNMFSPGTTYTFVVTLKLKPEASGWDNSPVILASKCRERPCRRNQSNCINIWDLTGRMFLEEGFGSPYPRTPLGTYTSPCMKLRVVSGRKV